MKAILWPYQYKNMRTAWAVQMGWLAGALERCGVTVKRHPGFACRGLERLEVYDHRVDNPADIAIYNHCDQSLIDERCLRARANWFFKPTVPDEFHVTLDPLGYGPYSSIAYRRPAYERLDMIEVDRFFETRVAGWVQSRVCKWGSKLRADAAPVDATGYVLVLGQCAGDSVVTKMDFGDYVTRLAQVVGELVRINAGPVVVKLHPYMNGQHTSTPRHGYDLEIKQKLEALSTQVHVITGMVSVHSLLPGCRVVMLANSGAGFEAMMHHKPIIAWGCPEYRWVAYDLRHLCDLKRALRLDWLSRTAQDKFLCWYCDHYCFYDLPSAERRVAELLDGLGKELTAARVDPAMPCPV